MRLGHALAILATCFHVELSPTDVTKVPDGDTFHAWFNTWDDQRKFDKIRVPGVNTPEMKGATLAKARDAQAFAYTWLKKDPFRMIYCRDRDKYGRAVPVAITRQGESLTQALIDAGHGVPSEER